MIKHTYHLALINYTNAPSLRFSAPPQYHDIDNHKCVVNGASIALLICDQAKYMPGLRNGITINDWTDTLIHSHGINRRDFMKLCAALAATMGLSSKAAAEMAESVTNPQRPPVIRIGAQECTGCTESLLRATHPTIENLMLDTISLEYDEVLRGLGHQVEENKHTAHPKYKGQYVLVVDGHPTKRWRYPPHGGGEPIVDHIRSAAEGAAAIIAIGSCAAWGGGARSGGTLLVQSATGGPGRQADYHIPGCPSPAQLPHHRRALHHLRHCRPR
ncbi:hydrogenase small subunit [Shigella flexneri]